VPAHQTSIITVFRVPETGLYGYNYRFGGDKPHHVINSCETLQQALSGCDPHLECLWEEPEGLDENVVMVARDYKPGSVMWRMTRLTLAELQAFRGSDIPTV
jgi:hypothetical protein